MITDYIPFGRDNAVPRSYLRSLTGLSDRKMRKEILAAKVSGAVICNRQDGKGYYQSDDITDIRDQYRQTTNRIIKLSQGRKVLYRKLKDAGEKV